MSLIDDLLGDPDPTAPATPAVGEPTPEQRTVAKAAIVKYVRDFDYVSFVDLEKVVARHFSVTGDQGCVLQPHNIVLWSRGSTAFTECIMELVHEHAIYPWPADQLTYLMDGCLLGLPLVKRQPPPHGYREPHWMPVVFRVQPLTEKPPRTPKARTAAKAKRRARANA